MLIDQGDDPRELERRQRAQPRQAQAIAEAVQAVTVGEAWAAYIDARRPRWGEHHHRDHLRTSKPGGLSATRGTRGRGETIAGPIYPLLAFRLRDLSPAMLSAWAERESATRPTVARLLLAAGPRVSELVR
ncbi:MAG: hypothetical protein V9G23_18815 [Giesbergeria sp.]